MEGVLKSEEYLKNIFFMRLFLMVIKYVVNIWVEFKMLIVGIIIGVKEIYICFNYDFLLILIM